MEDLLAILETIPDHRADKGKLHNLAESIIMLAILRWLYQTMRKAGSNRAAMHKLKSNCSKVEILYDSTEFKNHKGRQMPLFVILSGHATGRPFCMSEM